MKSFCVTFSLALDVACPDRLDIDWVAEQFAYKSNRFTTLHIEGDPGEAVITAAYSRLESTRRCADIAQASSGAGSLALAKAAALANSAAPPDQTAEPARRI